VGDAFQIEYAFDGVVSEEWNRLTVSANVYNSLLADWANRLWKEKYPNINLNHTQWRVIEKIVFDVIKTMADRRLQQGTFKNGMTIPLRAPISLPLDIDSLPHPND
jgi:hypothetical protein